MDKYGQEDVEYVIKRMYSDSDVSMSELLSSLEISGISIEAIAELYIDMRNSVGECISLIDEAGEFVL